MPKLGAPGVAEPSAAPAEPSVERLHALGSRLRAHVQLEERELFPYLERSLEAAELERIGERLGSSGARQRG